MLLRLSLRCSCHVQDWVRLGDENLTRLSSRKHVEEILWNVCCNCCLLVRYSLPVRVVVVVVDLCSTSRSASNVLIAVCAAKRWAFGANLKTWVLRAGSLRESGSGFYSMGPATEKATKRAAVVSWKTGDWWPIWGVVDGLRRKMYTCSNPSCTEEPCSADSSACSIVTSRLNVLHVCWI